MFQRVHHHVESFEKACLQVLVSWREGGEDCGDG